MQGWMLKQEFDSLILQYLDSLYRFALFLTGERQHAEELVCETCLKTHRFHKPLKYGTNHKTWLFATIHNIFINEYRQGSGEFSDADMDEGAEIGYEPPPAREIFRTDIKRALTELPDPLKAVVVLKDVLGFDYQEIARIVGCPVETVRSYLWRSRNLLKKGLKDYSFQHTVWRETV